jgi:hypothetical protein
MVHLVFSRKVSGNTIGITSLPGGTYFIRLKEKKNQGNKVYQALIIPARHTAL